MLFHILYENNLSKNNSDNIYANQYPIIENLTLKNHNETTTKETTLSSNYSFAVAKDNELTIGVKGILRNIVSAYGQDKYIDSTQTYLPLPKLSNVFQYQQSIVSGYADYVLTVGKFRIHPGLRVEQTGVSANFESTNTVANPSYFTLIPTFSIGYKPTKTTSIRLSYARQISRPQVWYLNPYLNNQNPQSLSTGNPDLTPEYVNSYELEGSYFKNGLNVSATIYDRLTTDVISSYTTLLDSSVFSTKYYNLGTANDLGASVNISGTVWKKFSVNFNLRAMRRQINTAFNGISRENAAIIGSNWAGITYNAGNGWKAGASGNYYLGNVTAQGTNSGFWSYTIAASYGFKKDAVRIRVFTDNVFHDTFSYQNTTNDANYSSYGSATRKARAFGIGVTVKFGELKEQVSRKRGIENSDKKSNG